MTELLVMAAALNVPPALLLFPGYPDGEIEYLPGRTASSKAVVDWFCGAARMPGEGTPSNPGVEIVEAVRQRDAVIADLALPPSEDLPKEANAQVRQKRLERMLDALQRITDLQSTSGEEN